MAHFQGSGEVGPAHCFHGEETFQRSVFTEVSPLPLPRRRPVSQEEAWGKPGAEARWTAWKRPLLLWGSSWPHFRGCEKLCSAETVSEGILTCTSCLCALPGGILKTEGESFSLQHPLQRQLSTFLSAPTQTSHRQGDTAAHLWRHTDTRHGAWDRDPPNSRCCFGDVL